MSVCYLCKKEEAKHKAEMVCSHAVLTINTGGGCENGME